MPLPSGRGGSVQCQYHQHVSTTSTPAGEGRRASHLQVTCGAVTKHLNAPESEWSKWTWTSEGDTMLNGAFFRTSGSSGFYIKAPSFAKSASFVPSITASAGALSCKNRFQC
ncbi:hypothetical protein EJB05_41633, partial [Eragrostis curvula]